MYVCMYVSMYVCMYFSTTPQEASFTKAQETLHYVSKELVGRCMQLVVPWHVCLTKPWLRRSLNGKELAICVAYALH